MKQHIAKQPIILSKFRKNQKEKENQNAINKKYTPQYDVSVLQSTFNIHKKNENYERMLQTYHLSTSNKPDLYQFATTSTNFENTSKMIKSSYNNNLDVSRMPLFQKGGNILNESVISIHKTNNSYKPNANSNKENTILYQPQLQKLKARVISVSNASSCKNTARESNQRQENTKEVRMSNEKRVESALREVQLFYNQNMVTSRCQKEVINPIKQTQTQQAESSKVKTYAAMVEQLQKKNERYAEDISKLNLQLQIQKKQKGLLIVRIDNVEKDLNILVQENAELQKLNMSSSRNSQNKANITQNIDTQVEHSNIPVYVRDSFTQTNVTIGVEEAGKPLNHIDCRIISQQERLILLMQSQEQEFKGELFRRQAFYGQRINLLEMQLNKLRCAYETKCQEMNARQMPLSRQRHH